RSWARLTTPQLPERALRYRRSFNWLPTSRLSAPRSGRSPRFERRPACWLASFVARHKKPQDGTMGRCGRCRQGAAVGFDDRAADRQSHAHAVGFGGEECVEDAVDILRADPCPRVFDRYGDTIRLVDFRLQPQHPGTIHHRAHRINGIADKIQNDLLQLSAMP